MQELLDWLEYLEDGQQQSKVRHKLKDILVIVLFATLANADDWVEIAMVCGLLSGLFPQIYCVGKWNTVPRYNRPGHGDDFA